MLLFRLKILCVLVLLLAVPSAAQSDTTRKFNFSGYGELYYSYDFSRPANQEKAGFIYNHKRHNEVNINLVYVKAAYFHKYIRANLSLMAGNYAQYNLSAEPLWARFIFEANIGVKLSKKKQLWLDAGVMPSHLGFESAVSADCWTLTRSLPAENSPYYETGIKLSYTNKKETIQLALLLLNGWQHIQIPSYLKKPSAGMQINYKPNDKITLNYSNFIGTEKPDSMNAFRFFHNLYAIYQPFKQLGFIIGFDIGTDKYSNAKYGAWFSPTVIVRYSINDRFRLACRGEYYSDPHQIIVSTNTANGFQLYGASANFDYQVNEKLLFRVEGKMYHSKDVIFKNNSRNNYSLTANMTISL